MRLNRTLDVESTRDSSVATPRSSKCTEFKYGSLSVHPSNPNPIHQGPTKNLNNYYRGVSYNLEKTVPLPVAFYTGKLHPLFDFRTKFTRRQACDLAISPQELLNSHNEQMRQKAQKQIDLKLKAKEEEQRLMQHINNQLRKENDNKEYSENVKKAIFLQENLNQLERKRSKKQKIKHEKLNETYDYFPFTHGDQVEAQQRKLNETLKEDLRKHLGSLNSTMEALSISPRSPKKQLEVPRFLLPAEHASLNQTRDRELAMSSALDRYQQELLDKERELQRKIEEKHKQEEIEKFIFVTKEIKHKKKLHRYKQALQAQIEENLIKKDKEKTENASPVRTNFGPEESREDMQNETSFKLNREKELKEFLINQMNDRLEKKRFYEEDERYEDCLINDNVQLVLCQEDDKYKEKRRKEKQLNKAT